MIFTDSRYVDGLIVPQPDSQVVVRRTFPTPVKDVVYYTWKESDRLDRIAAQFLGKPEYWWQIMDVNPIIQNAQDIRPGEQIRIPRRV
jgi:nucleoid-associated protein YgaU